MSGGTGGTGGEGSRRSVSTLLGCGCAALITVFMLFVVATTWLTYRAGERLQGMADDPPAARAAVQELLPYDELPAGYRPVGTLTVPWMMDVAFIMRGAEGDGSADDEPKAALLFVKVRDLLGRGGRTRDLLSSEEGESIPIDQEQVTYRPSAFLGRGELTVDGARVTWSASRGAGQVRLGAEPADEEGGDGEPQAMIMALFAVDCGDDGWERHGMWMLHDPAADRPAGEVDWTGTPADPAALEEFLSHFRLCAESS